MDRQTVNTSVSLPAGGDRSWMDHLSSTHLQILLWRAEVTSWWIHGALIRLVLAKHTHGGVSGMLFSVRAHYEGIPPSVRVWLHVAHRHSSVWDGSMSLTCQRKVVHKDYFLQNNPFKCRKKSLREWFFRCMHFNYSLHVPNHHLFSLPFKIYLQFNCNRTCDL